MLIRCFCLVLFASLVSCGSDSSDAPSHYFHPRQETLFASEPTPGDLRIVITNAIPKVQVPEPHLPTVIHLNAKLCSYRKCKRCNPSNNHEPAPPSSDQRCINLSPSIYVDSSVTYVVARPVYQVLLDEEQPLLELKFMSSSQTTRHSYSCQLDQGRLNPSTTQTNELNVTVDGQHSLSFHCR